MDPKSRLEKGIQVMNDLKDRGNEKFHERHYSEALELYQKVLGVVG